MLKTISKISRHVENHVKNSKAGWNIVFKMHYRFQHALKFSLQHALQMSTCIIDFNMCWNFQNSFSRCFQHISNIKIHLWIWTMLKTGLKTMSNISKCVENYVENFKVCWKPYRKFQSVSKITVTWPFHNPFHQFQNIIAVFKMKCDIINEDYRSLWCYMWGVIEILCGLEEKIGPVCM